MGTVVGKRKRLHLSTLLLLIVGLTDLCSTIVWINNGGFEGNPLFASLLYQGIETFALAKILFLAVPIAILEYARKSHPSSAEAGTWIAFSFYLLLWGGQILKLGHALKFGI